MASHTGTIPLLRSAVTISFSPPPTAEIGLSRIWPIFEDSKILPSVTASSQVLIGNLSTVPGTEIQPRPLIQWTALARLDLRKNVYSWTRSSEQFNAKRIMPDGRMRTRVRCGLPALTEKQEALLTNTDKEEKELQDENPYSDC
jgi:hypothetical protein